MANKTIPDFGPVGAIAGGDLYAIWDLSAAANRYISHADLETAIITDLASVYQPLNSKLTTFAALADAAGVLTSDGAGNYSWGSAGGSQWIDSGSDIYFSAGKVGIGTAPSVPLDILSTSDETAQIQRWGNSSSTIGLFVDQNDNDPNSIIASVQKGDLLVSKTADLWISESASSNADWKKLNKGNGVSGSFTTVDLKTVTVVDGQITSIV